MDLDYGSDAPDDEAEGATQRSDQQDDVSGNAMEDEESNAGSDDAMDEDSPAASRSMRSSRSPEAAEDEDEDEEENEGTEGRTRQQASEKPLLQPGADSCAYYDMMPTMAAPQGTHINCIATTKNLRWFFTGGQDGYIRKHDFHQTITGKVPLTVAQKHPFVDTVQKSGVLLSYWENDEIDNTNSTNLAAPSTQTGAEKTLSPVYCMAVQRDALWLLSGQYSGGIKLQSVRIEEGKTVATLRAHTGPVSVLQLMSDERSLLSGGWDKHIYDWDLETGKTRRNFVAGHKITGQVSTIALRPSNAMPIDLAPSSPRPQAADTTDPAVQDLELGLPKADSPASSNSFDPLFDEEDDNLLPELPGAANGAAKTSNLEDNLQIGGGTELLDPATDGNADGAGDGSTTTGGPEDVFLSACIDGTMSLWDRRMSSAVARIGLPAGVPPWCMSACWSLDGGSFFCGRRNQTVEEYDVRRLTSGTPARTIKLPHNSGPVSSVTAMPNHRSLICASADNVRMYDLAPDSASGMPFLIIPGHHGGVISQFWVDESCRYAFSVSGSRGWDGISTEVAIGYEIKPISK